MSCKSSLFPQIKEISASFFYAATLFFFFSPFFLGEYSYLRTSFFPDNDTQETLHTQL